MHPRHVVDGVVGHRGDQVPGARLLALEGEDLRGVAKQVRLPLVGVAADEAVEVLEAHADGPLVEGSDLAGREGRHVVVLPEPGRAVSVVLQHAADRRLVAIDDAVVAGEAGALLGDHAEACRMVVAAGDQRGAGRRAKRSGEDAVVAQAVGREFVHRRRGDHAAKGAGHAETGIVGDDQQHVRRALGRHGARCPPWLALQCAVLDDAAKGRVRWRQLVARDRAGGTRRAEHAVDVLRPGVAGHTEGRRQAGQEPEESSLEGHGAFLW